MDHFQNFTKQRIASCLSKIKAVLILNTIVARKHGTKWPFIKAKTGTKD